MATGANGSQLLTTRITWTSEDGTEEQWKEGDVLVASPRPGFRDFGAFWSYARRSAFLAALGIVAGDEPDAGGANMAQEARPPRADRGARPAGGDEDPEAVAAEVLKELAALPSNTPMATVDEMAKGVRGMQFTAETEQRIRADFQRKREQLRAAK